MKSLKYIIMSVTMLSALTSCSDYLEIYPENSQPADKFWATKADVDASLNAGYYYLREAVTPNLIPWGELRAGCIYGGNGALQSFQLKPTSGTVVSWAPMYKIINQANLVLENARKAFESDDTYKEEELNSHYCEAYFLRALAYFYIVRNWRDAPLITEAYSTDEVSYTKAKSPSADIIAQIKSDLQQALTIGAAKEAFATTWETKSRATLWSIYALMADVCLWNQEFDECINYADKILNSTSPYAPRLIKTPGHYAWFAMFNPGNSNESIYEVQWSISKYSNSVQQTNSLTAIFDPDATKPSGYNFTYRYSPAMIQNFNNEFREQMDQQNFAIEQSGRTMYGGYWVKDLNNYNAATDAYVWKYIGSTTITARRTNKYYDVNFIIYRVADVMLMKAEALIMRQMGQAYADNVAAIDLVNEIRTRSNIKKVTIDETTDFKTLLDYVLYERLMELAGEGKAWYDFLRIGRYKDPAGLINFKNEFLIENVINYNKQANESWIRSVLNDENAWYLPVPSNEINADQLLEQNPYYL